MSTVVVSDTFRGSRRIRLLFSGPLAAGAFTSTSFYSVASSDLSGPNPITVEAVFAISTDPNSVELSVSCDWVQGGLYTVTLTAVPCVSGGPFTGTQTDRYPLVVQSIAGVTAVPNQEPTVTDFALITYGRDLAWSGYDYALDPTGDLAVVAGRDNWIGAMGRRMFSDGVAWDASYGAKPSDYVDAPETYTQPLAGRFLGQARLDDRTKKAQVGVVADPTIPNAFDFALFITGSDGQDPVQVPVPTPSQT